MLDLIWDIQQAEPDWYIQTLLSTSWAPPLVKAMFVSSYGPLIRVTDKDSRLSPSYYHRSGTRHIDRNGARPQYEWIASMKGYGTIDTRRKVSEDPWWWQRWWWWQIRCTGSVTSSLVSSLLPVKWYKVDVGDRIRWSLIYGDRHNKSWFALPVLVEALILIPDKAPRACRCLRGAEGPRLSLLRAWAPY